MCLVQFPSHLIAGIKHFLSKTSPSSDKYAQYLKPPCVVQVFHMFPTITLVQPPKTHSPGPPPCLRQRPLHSELVVLKPNLNFLNFVGWLGRVCVSGCAGVRVCGCACVQVLRACARVCVRVRSRHAARTQRVCVCVLGHATTLITLASSCSQLPRCSFAQGRPSHRLSRQ